MQFSEAICLLSKTYNSIDIRSLIVRDCPDDPWRGIFLEIRFTMDQSDEINHYYGTKKDRWKQRGRNVKLVLESRPFSEFSAIMHQVESNQIILEVNVVETSLKNFDLSNSEIADYDGRMYTREQDYPI